MDELKEIKLKNYQYLNEVAIKGETLFTGSSLMELFPFVKSLGVEVSTASSTIEASAAWTRMNFSSISIPCFWICNRAKFSSISVPMTWPRSLMETSGSSISQQTSGGFWSKHKLSCPIQRFTSWLSTQLICICLADTSIYQWMKLRTPEILTVATRLLRKLPKPMVATLLIVMLSWSMIGKSRSWAHLWRVHLYANAYLKVFEALEPYLWIKKIWENFQFLLAFSLDYSTIDVKSEKLKWGYPYVEMV